MAKAEKKYVEPLDCLSSTHKCERSDCIHWYINSYNELCFPNDGRRGNWMICNACLTHFHKLQKENLVKAKKMKSSIKMRAEV